MLSKITDKNRVIVAQISTSDRSREAEIFLKLFCTIIIVAQILRVV